MRTEQLGNAPSPRYGLRPVDASSDESSQELHSTLGMANDYFSVTTFQVQYGTMETYALARLKTAWDEVLMWLQAGKIRPWRRSLFYSMMMF